MILRKSLLATSILAATLGLTACGGSSSNDSSPTTPTTPTNSVPTAISISDVKTVMENLAAAQVVGTLVATDADSADTHTFTTEDERFVIEGTTLSVKEGVVIDFEAEPKIMVMVKVTDSASGEFSQELEVTVTDEMDYDFLNKDTGESTVSYSGQTARHILIKEIYNYIASEAFAEHAGSMTAVELKAELNKFYKLTDDEYSAIWENKTLSVTTTPAAKQTTLFAVSSSHKDLSGKIAGNDSEGQHKVWNDGTSFIGWEGLATNTPEGLIDVLFDQLVTRAQSANVETPLGDEIDSKYVTADGVDLKQMIQKFLYGAVAFSQGADDYLDDKLEGDPTKDRKPKGLLSDNTSLVDGKAYTNLEHQWDEGFGYFGAARNYLSYSDDEIAGKGGRDAWQGYQDTNADGNVDLKSEYNFGNSTNAAKRDRGSNGTTDLTKEAFEAFYAGRKLIADNAGSALTEEQAKELKATAKTAVLAWEKSISATVVHYINDTRTDLEEMKAGGYDVSKFETLAKHWSEMKGFALNLQFNPDTPFNDAGHAGKLAKVLNLMGNKPVISGGTAAIEAYSADLLEARAILTEVYGFDADVAANW
ncbi:DUF4856 domain-containing protein [Pseudoalteromonas sp. MMG005]|uniref:DUF4856 domain-containing protein n=1 Tax=Pseudoalteromonas sp. MMG005 TaxID=2822682 RepID=UPI001B3A0DFE|nr:DUF4856 domain-containing protein [Pseudoalteromonas sp. MMG005]MBQ4846219.1 DUF4856 domain-containing protein [Pseudoalteromonas sp. MMG005]